MKKEIILTTLNSKFVHSNLSLYYLLEGVKKYTEFDCTIIEGTINENIELFALKILDYKPKIVGLSCYIWNITKTIELINILKNSDPSIIIILGGPEVSFNSYDVLNNNSNVNYIISGKGELAFPNLLKAIINNTSLNNISGLTYKENNIIYQNKQIPYLDYLNPYSETYMNNINGRITYFEASRGCPFTCAFCLSGKDDNPYYFDLEDTFNNLIKLSNSSTSTIKFVDRTFNAHIKRCNEILKFIIHDERVNKDVTYHFEIAGDLINQEFIDIIKKAPVGLIQFEIGLQTFNEKTLTEIDRKTNIKVLVNNIKKLLEVNKTHVHIDLIAGLPYEDLESFKKSFNIAYDLKSHMLQLGFLKLIHGSKLMDENVKYFKSFDSKPPYEIIETNWLSKQDLKVIHRVEDILERMLNSHRFTVTFDYLLTKTKLTPFDLLTHLSHNLTYNYDISLDDFTRLLYNYDPDLRDVLVIDRLASNKTGKLIKELKVEFKSLKRYRLAFNKITPEIKNVKRGFEYIVSLNKLVYVDYINSDLITNRYQVNYLSIDDLDISKV